MGGVDIPPPAPPAAPPGPTDAEVRQAQLDARRRLRRRQGQTATILTGPAGDPVPAEAPARGTLLGGGR